MVVDAAKRKPGLICDLTHGGGVVSLFHEEFKRGIFNGQTGYFAFF
jgi:hypothetical protein